MKRFFSPYAITRIAIAAAIYVVITLLSSGLSYELVQFRLSEVLLLLCCLNPEFCVAMVLGCAISNLFSPMGLVDVVFGSLATLLAVIPMWRCKNLYISALFPVITNAIIVGIELHLMLDLPVSLFWAMASVAFGEFVVVFVVGVPLFKFVLTKHKGFMRIIGASVNKL